MILVGMIYDPSYSLPEREFEYDKAPKTPTLHYIAKQSNNGVASIHSNGKTI